MLPWSESLLKRMAQPLDGQHTLKQVRTYQVRAGATMVHSGSVVASVSDFSTLEDGGYQFGDNLPYQHKHLFQLWLTHAVSRSVQFSLPLLTVQQIHDALSGWFKRRHDPEFNPNLVVRIEPIPGEHHLMLEIEGEGEPFRFPQLWLKFAVSTQGEVQPLTFAPYARQFLLALTPFAKLKEHCLINVRYADGEPPLFFDTHTQGHQITAGLPFVVDEEAAA